MMNSFNRNTQGSSSIIVTIQVNDASLLSEDQQIKKDEEYKQRAFYLSDKLIKAIVIKTAESDLDKSGVVRSALDMYLADILKKM